MTDTQLLVALVVALAINAHRIRRRVVRFLWGSDHVAAWMARRLRRGNRCFSCASRMTEDEREHYGTACERCEARDMAEGRNHG